MIAFNLRGSTAAEIIDESSQSESENKFMFNNEFTMFDKKIDCLQINNFTEMIA